VLPRPPSPQVQDLQDQSQQLRQQQAELAAAADAAAMKGGSSPAGLQAFMEQASQLVGQQKARHDQLEFRVRGGPVLLVCVAGQCGVLEAVV
jgi:hypothetical protein